MMEKLDFQQPLLQSSVSHLSDIILVCWYGAQETYLFIKITIENQIQGGGGINRESIVAMTRYNRSQVCYMMQSLDCSV